MKGTASTRAPPPRRLLKKRHQRRRGQREEGEVMGQQRGRRRHSPQQRTARHQAQEGQEHPEAPEDVHPGVPRIGDQRGVEGQKERGNPAETSGPSDVTGQGRERRQHQDGCRRAGEAQQGLQRASRFQARRVGPRAREPGPPLQQEKVQGGIGLGCAQDVQHLAGGTVERQVGVEDFVVPETGCTQAPQRDGPEGQKGDQEERSAEQGRHKRAEREIWNYPSFLNRCRPGSTTTNAFCNSDSECSCNWSPDTFDRAVHGFTRMLRIDTD
jgi:hypothetical protein